MGTPVLSPAKQQSFCRSCDIPIEKGTYKVSLYSIRNRGQWIHLCLDCCEKIGLMVSNHKEGITTNG